VKIGASHFKLAIPGSLSWYADVIDPLKK